MHRFCNSTPTGATSTTNGAANTIAIVTAEGAGTTYAAGYCAAYAVDSQGITPCQTGNTCYNDWFLPAGDNVTASGQLYCLWTNKTFIGGFADAVYWSSTEFSTSAAWCQQFIDGGQFPDLKDVASRVRCVRAFTP